MAISTTDYEAYRPLLRTLAYRMLGSVAEAEDIVQDALADYYLRTTAAALEAPAERSCVKSPAAVKHEKAYLIRMVTNRCINLKQSARVRREQYVGNWLPEPSVSYMDASSGFRDPADQIERKESITYAMLVLMEELSGVERAVFLLRETLGYDYAEIADIVQKSETNCRKLFSRAKEKLAKKNTNLSEADSQRRANHMGGISNGHAARGEAGQSGSKEAGEGSGDCADKQDSRLADERIGGFADGASQSKVTALAHTFISALDSGSFDQLIGLLAKDAVLTTDGGGKVNAAIFPIYGRDRVIAFYEGVLRKNPLFESYSFADVSGQPGIVLFSGEETTNVVTFGLDEAGKIDRIFMIRNPEKLAHISKPSVTEGLKRS
ncbi:sigma-70 family RNA polymerase sigma factor [Paenibacillus sp. HB172176]|uniref:sigma-70 family RNA polymerase sigma factor n=1 Tax=Paenibacillus sp. HB172176 TaxID=2493690 RepID=UPI00143BF58B|nr:sigma-70 family RNA polymerase sigma factor [Paenibacillus sp. HB172176]